MLRLFFYLAEILNKQLATRVLILNYNDKKLANIIVKIFAKIILCNNRVVVNQMLVACNFCLSCDLFFRKRHLDFFSCSFKLFNSSDGIDKILMFINSNSIYSKIKVILIHNIHFVSIEQYHLISALVNAKSVNVFFIFTVKSVYLSAYFDCVFLVQKKINSYLEYISFNRKYGSVFLFRQMCFLLFNISKNHYHVSMILDKLHMFNFCLFLFNFWCINVNILSIKFFLKKNLKYIFFI